MAGTSAEVDRSTVQRNDTIRWKLRSKGSSFGLVEWTDDEGVHVKTATPAGTGRYHVPWDRVAGHWPGRAEYDRRAHA